MNANDRLTVRDLERMTRRGRTISEHDVPWQPVLEQLLDVMRDNEELKKEIERLESAKDFTEDCHQHGV